MNDLKRKFRNDLVKGRLLPALRGGLSGHDPDAGRPLSGAGRSRHLTFKPALAALALALAACGQGPAEAAEAVFDAPAAAVVSKESGGDKVAVFAGGCFWGVEAVFSHVKGVKSAVSGYHGGNKDTASYSRVSSGGTGHAEAVRVVYDPKQVRYDQLLQILFSVVADPTLKNRQGPDAGTQYRAAIVPMDKEQRRVADAYVSQMGKSGVWNRPIAVQVENYSGFYKAEDHHQDFANKNPDHPYIRRWDAPKVVALKAKFPSLYSPSFKTG